MSTSLLKTSLIVKSRGCRGTKEKRWQILISPTFPKFSVRWWEFWWDDYLPVTSVLSPQLYGGLWSEPLQVLGGHSEDVVGVSLETAQWVVLAIFLSDFPCPGTGYLSLPGFWKIHLWFLSWSSQGWPQSCRWGCSPGTPRWWRRRPEGPSKRQGRCSDWRFSSSRRSGSH